MMTEDSNYINELTPDQFRSTMTDKMINVTESAEPSVDIWPYAELLAGKKIVSDYVIENNLVEVVYANQENSFHHILLPTHNLNIFVVIVVNLSKENIEGHYILDLKNEYNLS